MKSRSHKSKQALFRSRSGFTLIEVIATLVLASILIAMLLPLISSGLEGSRRALRSLPETYSLRTEMDAVWQLYRAGDRTNLSLSGMATEIASEFPSLDYTLIWVDFSDTGVETLPAVTQDALRLTLGPNSQGETLTTYFFPIP
jgi:prepilin-type N-terminal cleavage/methylation domain-containing protein